MKILLILVGAWSAMAVCLGLLFGRWMSLQKDVSDRDELMEQAR
ncbi:hypothetical protein [Stenotrophomonas sp. CFBP8980]|nr:hypothetical protein [Stenotrophomonas sp. CFBP8980]MDY1035183.1 hypothetical protein [Stenotrophomonas sp. CFBP8980]